MCEMFNFHHFCGHIFEKTTGTCSQSIHRRVDKQLKYPQSKPSQLLCVDAPNTIHLIPTVCKQCSNHGVVSDYFKTQPGAKFDVLRSCKASLLLEKVKKEATAAGQAADGMVALGDDDGNSSEAESMPFIPVSEAGSSQSSRTSFNGSEAPRSARSSILVNEGDTRKRIKELKERVSAALEKVREEADQI
jgi:hypothetical protein